MNTAQSPASSLSGMLSNSTVQSVLGVLIVLAVCSIAYYWLSKLRDSTTQDVAMDELLRKNFEEMRSGGDINDAEFRNIASLLEGQSRGSPTPSPKTNINPIAESSDEK
ncbi:MAG: hypothetical protein ABL921_05350 [Pirellula sp.]